MTLDRWLSLLFLGFCLAYGYSAFFVMDALLPAFAKFSPVWPSSFPKILAICGSVLALGQLTIWHQQEVQPAETSENTSDIEWQTAALMINFMIAYALLLRPAGFVCATILFLVGSAMVLGERRLAVLIPVTVIATLSIWYLVDQVLGIFLRPWPFLVYGGM